MARGMSRIPVLASTLYVAYAGSHVSKLKLAQDVNYPPYASMNETSGELIGFGADIARGMNAMCDELDIEVVQTKWADCWGPDGLGPKLADGSLDACMTYTHTKGMRPKVADFSNGILSVNKAAGLLVLLDDNGEPVISGMSDLSGKKVVDVGGWAPTADGLDFVENKCAGVNYASDYILSQATDSDNNNDLALSMLLDGKVDAMFVYADQAYNYKKVCKSGVGTITWTCANWEKFGTKFAYVQTGQFGYVNNGTTLAMTKKGSGVVEKLNPCLQKFMATKDYYDVCVKYDFVDTCYPNSFFPGADEIVVHDYNKPTNEHVGDCSDGYCSCPTGPAPPPPPPKKDAELSGSMGQTSCPCIGKLPDGIAKGACDKPYKDADGMCSHPTVQGNTFPYPMDYGTTCKSHIEPGHTDCYNVGLGTEKHADEKQEWCDDPWCYIDPCNCDVGSQYKSGYFGEIVTYTYLTCTTEGSDNIDRYSGTVDGSSSVASDPASCTTNPPATEAPAEGGSGKEEKADSPSTPAAGGDDSTTEDEASAAAIANSAKALIAVLLCCLCLFNSP